MANDKKKHTKKNAKSVKKAQAHRAEKTPIKKEEGQDSGKDNA